MGPPDYPPEPRLSYPTAEAVILSGQEFLEFKWWDDFSPVRAYEFRLYKGYNMYADDLLMKQELPPNTSSFKVKSEIFEDGKTYTWSLIQIGLGGSKSDASFNSFRVIKK